MASLRAVAVRAVWLRMRLMAATRNTAAARLAEGWVLLLRRRPPEIRFWGARVSQAVKWCAVGQRRRSVPISAISLRAL